MPQARINPKLQAKVQTLTPLIPSSSSSNIHNHLIIIDIFGVQKRSIAEREVKKQQQQKNQTNKQQQQQRGGGREREKFRVLRRQNYPAGEVLLRVELLAGNNAFQAPSWW